MLKKITFQVKDEALALDKAAQLLKLPAEKITLAKIRRVQEDGETLIEFEAASNINLGVLGKDYLISILSSMGFNCQAEFRIISDEEISFRLNTPNNGLVIGKEGRNLASLQYLVRNYLSSMISRGENLRVSVDIANYQDHHRKNLEILALKVAKEVQSTHLAVRLDPMNAFDRRIIHEHLADWAHITTESVGEGENRAIVIAYKE
ncbi:MAG: KH domain-containing protein [Acholeplasmatales bacterium]|jgi:spoIIIJ-associated protein|nr:KH domain-containing protein [Acholeplasmatales bacterium]